MFKIKEFFKGVICGLPVGFIVNLGIIMLIAPLTVKLIKSDWDIYIALLLIDVIIMYIAKKKYNKALTFKGFIIGILTAVPISLLMAVLLTVHNMQYID